MMMKFLNKPYIPYVNMLFITILRLVFYFYFFVEVVQCQSTHLGSVQKYSDLAKGVILDNRSKVIRDSDYDYIIREINYLHSIQTLIERKYTHLYEERLSEITESKGVDSELLLDNYEALLKERLSENTEWLRVTREIEKYQKRIEALSDLDSANFE